MIRQAVVLCGGPGTRLGDLVADVVMFVHREEYYQTTDEDKERVKGQAEIIIAKQRNGPIGDVKLLWQHDYTRFVNLEHRPYDEFEQFSSF